ncbi:hypothetical protein [Nocardioides sp. SR21]|uniref:hypothetical protein n=1 Tax=Nocardioides sp. SR21 TaxID=2919501 RepID=UPI001FA9B485|nr:hypothetical protein [Nocardioides sp. SR21]
MRPAVLLAALLLAGCGSEAALEADPAGAPYDGPMFVELDYRDRATALEASGAAGLALECAGDPRRGGGAGYDDGLVEVQDSAQDALDNWLEEEWAAMPDDGYRVERVDDGRALLSYDVGEQTKAAVVVHDDVTDYQDDTGWGVEAWATCDPAELGVEVAEDLGFEVWEDSAGSPVPTSEVVSFPGAEHCDWQDLTWLWVGKRTDWDRTYDAYLGGDSGELSDYLTTTPDSSATLPAHATDTGWQRDGRALWLGDHPKAAYLVSLDDPSDVQRWPATTEPIGCA